MVDLRPPPRFPAGRHLGGLARFDLLPSPQGAADRRLLGRSALLTWLPCRMTCPTCGHRTRIATASWMRCGSPAVTADSAPMNSTPGWGARFQPGRSASWPAHRRPADRARSQRQRRTRGRATRRQVRTGGALAGTRAIELRTRECRVTLDFTHAVITSNVLRIETDMVHGKLFIVSSPGIVIDTDGLTSPLQAQAPLQERRRRSPSPHRARRKASHAKVIEQRP